MYICVMFPYPSGQGLHVGHYYNYALADTLCRYYRHKGIEVFQPFGYDAFGLPAENHAKKIGGDPKIVTEENINRFRDQMTRMNTQFEERLVTSSESYQKWSQHIFKIMQKRGLAYKANKEVNFCGSCDTTLANEQVKNNACERCQTPVVLKNMSQWFFKTTAYKERLLKNLDTIDYPQSTIKQQREWIEHLNDWCISRQRKWGCPIPIEGESDTMDTFVDSSFYYLRYMTRSENEFLPQEDYRPVDIYIGGSEHACMHLIYARFVHMVLFDEGIVPCEEPFKKVIHQGMITKDGHKMSKSLGNTVDPDQYDPDVLRMYLMFMGPFTEGGDFSDRNIQGVERFFRRMNTWLDRASSEGDDIPMEKLEQGIDRNMERLKFNRVVSDLMTFYNQHKNTVPSIDTRQRMEQLMQVFAPSFRKGPAPTSSIKP